MSNLEHTNHENEEHEHVMTYGSYIIIWASLIALTVLTVGVAGINLGDYTLFVAMLVASIKSMIVINVFMHIKYDGILFKGILAVFFLVFIAFLSLLGLDIFTTMR